MSIRVYHDYICQCGIAQSDMKKIPYDVTQKGKSYIKFGPRRFGKSTNIQLKEFKIIFFFRILLQDILSFAWPNYMVLAFFLLENQL